MKHKHDMITSYTTEDNVFEYAGIKHPYGKLVAINEVSSSFEGDASNQRLTIPALLGERLLRYIKIEKEYEGANCHSFARSLHGLGADDKAPKIPDDVILRNNYLSPGSMGIIEVGGIVVPHTIGCGLGQKALQVLSRQGEIGIARVEDVVGFYKNLHPGKEVLLWEVPSMVV